MILTIREQNARMRQLWPGFRVLAAASWLIHWEGRLQPYHQGYTVRVFFCLGRDLENAEIMPCAPRVTIVAPLLRRRAEEPGEPIPHHYPNEADPSRPILCICDPANKEWCFGDLIAETTIPWAIDWLACYEGWLATGTWAGGGRHPMIQENRPCPMLNPKSRRQNGQRTILLVSATNDNHRLRAANV